MSQQNIDFGTFPDDPSADAIRTAFQKVQQNFNEIYNSTGNATVQSINRSAGAGLQVNQPTGNVIITANISSITVRSTTLGVSIGGSPNISSSSAIYTQTGQTLWVEIPANLTISNLVANGTISAVGNLTVGNANLGNLVIANYFSGSGNRLSNIQGANITGPVPTATSAVTVSQNSQPNITSVGTLTSLSVSGNIISGNIYSNLGIIGAQYFKGDGSNLSNINVSNVSGTIANANYSTYAGDVVNSSQSNITSLGTLTSVSVSGNANVGNLATNGLVTATGNIVGGNLVTGGSLSVTGNANVGNIGATGVSAATLSITGNANVGNIGATGVVATTLFGSLTTANQPNVTSLGTLTSLSVSGNANVGNIGTSGLITAIGNIIGGNLVTNGILSVGGNTTLGNLSVTGNLTAGNITVDSIVNGSSNVDITNPNGNVTVGVNGFNNILVITSTGINVTGTFSANGNANLGNLGTAQILASANITSPQLISNIATGTSPLVVTSTTQVANLNVANAGHSNTANTVTTNAQPNITSTGTLSRLTVSGNTNLGNVGNVYIGGGSPSNTYLTTDGNGNLTWSVINNLLPGGTTGSIQFKDANGIYQGNTGFTFNNTTGDVIVPGNISASIITGTLSNTSNVQSNITQVGTLDYLIVKSNGGYIAGGNANITAGNISVTGNIQGAYILGNGSQLTGIDATAIQNGSANVRTFNNANVTVSAAGNANTLVVTGTGTIVNGTLSSTGNANVGNIGATGVVATTVSGTLTTTAQPNITSTGTLTSLSVSGNANIGNIGAIGGVFTTVAGSLTTSAQPNVTSTGTLTSLSSSGNITGANIITGGIVSATGNGTFGNVSATAHTGITVSVSGNITGGNISTGGTITATGNVTAPNFIGNVVGNISGNLTVNGSNTQVLFNDNGLANATSGFTFDKVSGLVSVTGNIRSGNLVTPGLITATGNITGNLFIGNGSSLSSIAGANVTDQVNYAANANSVALANVSGAGNLASLNKDGNASNILYGNGVFASAPVTYGNSNVATFLTSYGSNTITTTGNISVGNLTTTGKVSTGTLSVSGTSNLGAVGNVTITGGSTGQYLQTNGSGTLTWANVTTQVAGAFVFTQSSPATTWTVDHNLGVQYVNVQLIDSTGNSFTGRYNYPTIAFSNTTRLIVTFDSAQSGWAAVTSGGGAQGPQGANATVGGSNTQVQFNNAGVLGGSSAFTFNNSSNLVSMTSLSISGNANVGNIGGGSGVFSTIAGSLTTGSQSNITAVGTLTSLSVSGNANVGNIGATNIVGTISTASQTNITAVGTLASLSVTANANIGNIGTGGLITATGNITGANIIASSYDIRGVTTGISAAGTAQGTATILTKAINIVSTVSAGANGVVLPTAVAGMSIYVTNNGSTSVNVYPASGGVVNALATNAAYSQPVNSTVHYIAPTATQWYTVTGTYA